MPVAIRQGKQHAPPRHGFLVHVRGDLPVVVVVGQHGVPAGRVREFFSPVRERSEDFLAGRIHPEQRNRPEIIPVQHNGALVSFQMLPQQLRHFHEMPYQGADALYAQQLVIGERRHGPRPGSGGFQRVHARLVFPEMIEVGHEFAVAFQQPEVFVVLDQNEAGYIRRKAGLVKIDAHGVGEGEVAYLPAGPCKCPQRPGPKAQFVFLEIVVVEDGPGPSDDRVGVYVRAVGEIEFLDQRIPERYDGSQVVHAERIGAAHGGDEGGDLFALLERFAGRFFQQAQVYFVFGGGGDGDHLVRPHSDPSGNAVSAVMPSVRHEQHGFFGQSAPQTARAGFFQADSDAVQRRARAAEREQARRLFLIVADEARRDAGGFDLGQREKAAVFVPSEVRIVQGGEQHPDHAGDGGRANDVLLRPRMSHDGHSSQVAHEFGCYLLHGGHVAWQSGMAGCLVVRLHDGAEHGQVHFQGIHLVQRIHERMHQIRIVNPIRSRLGKCESYILDEFSVRCGHSLPLSRIVYSANIPPGIIRPAAVRSLYTDIIFIRKRVPGGGGWGWKRGRAFARYYGQA